MIVKNSSQNPGLFKLKLNCPRHLPIHTQLLVLHTKKITEMETYQNQNPFLQCLSSTFILEMNSCTLSSQAAYVKALTKGDLSSLKWIQAPFEDFPNGSNPQREICSVYYASLNFRDIMLATGKLSADSIPGMLSI